MLRWSAEAAASERPALSRTGVAVLEGLGESELLQDEDRPLVHTVARSHGSQHDWPWRAEDPKRTISEASWSKTPS